MAAEDFGRFVKELRSQQMFENEVGEVRPWTQAELAEKSGLSKKQISDLERGKTGNLTVFYEKVVCLANAFKLSEVERGAFYAKAGFHYAPKSEEVDWESVRSLVSQIPYPTIVRNPVWDYIAFNQLHIATFNFTPDTLRRLDDESFGANNLRMIFDPTFSDQTSEKTPLWYETIVEKFRAVSFPYMHTARYKTIVQAMKKNRVFYQFWTESELGLHASADQVYRPRISINTINNKQVGKIEFLSLQMASTKLPGNLIVTIYAPIQSSQEKFEKVRAAVKINNVHFFKRHKLD